ncbi:hypothetical protein OBBRIDRAFT_807639 [Obba rivulosa]|uniref:Uncharacterized protein n=1 Tax=Obba rivulosa TaxID=1052685 RepID=A0A8E2AIS1_9APHY|nr:hypothetical protein OBBRIDRAFT_807639 [Obba rivulosa]
MSLGVNALRRRHYHFFHRYDLWDSANCLQFDRRGEYLAAGEDDGRVIIFDLRKLRKAGSSSRSSFHSIGLLGTTPVSSMIWLADTLFVGYASGAIFRYKINFDEIGESPPETTQISTRLSGSVNCMDVDPMSSSLAAGVGTHPAAIEVAGNTETAVVRVLGRKYEIPVIGYIPKYPDTYTVQMDENIVLPVKFIHDGRALLLGSSCGMVDIVDLETGSRVDSSISSHHQDDIIQTLAYHEDGDQCLIATASAELGPESYINLYYASRIGLLAFTFLIYALIVAHLSTIHWAIERISSWLLTIISAMVQISVSMFTRAWTLLEQGASQFVYANQCLGRSLWLAGLRLASSLIGAFPGALEFLQEVLVAIEARN